MKKTTLLFFAAILTCSHVGQVIAASSDTIPKEQLAKIEGLGYTALLSPAVKEKWPDLRSFNITTATGDNVSAFSKSEVVVGPGQCSITVEVRTRQHGTATLTLAFEVEAGGNYVLRPVYRGNVLAASIKNVDTGEFVARTWPARKSKPAQEANALVDAP